MAELRENRQTQCNLRDQEDTQNRKDDIKFANKSKVWSYHVQPQFKTPEQTVCCQDYSDQQKFCSCNEYVYVRISYILQRK